MSSGGAGASGAVFALGELFLDLAVHGIEGLKSTLGGVQTQAQTMATAAQASVQRMGTQVQAQVQAAASSAGAAVQRTAGSVQALGQRLTAIQGPVGSVFRGTAAGAGTLGSALVTVGKQGVDALSLIGHAAASLTGQLQKTAMAAAAVGRPGAATTAAGAAGGPETAGGAAGPPTTAGTAVGSISTIEAGIGKVSAAIGGLVSSVSSVVSMVVADVSMVLGVVGAIGAVVGAVVSAVGAVIGTVISVVEAALNAVIGVVGALGSALGAMGRAAKAAFEYALKSAREFGDQIDAAVRKVGSLARWALAGGSAAVSGSIYLFESAQDQIRNLNTALKVTGNEVDGNSKKFQAFALGIQSQTVVSKEVIIGLQTRAIQTGIQIGNVNDLVKASIGLARLYGLSNQEAMELVRRSLEGPSMGLRRLIPELAGVKDAQERINIILKKGTEGYATMIEDTKTFSGQLAIARRTAEDFSRSVGEIFAPTFLPYLQSAIGWLRTLQAAFAQLSQPIKDLIVKWAGIAAAALAFAAALPSVLSGIETVGSAILFLATNPIALAIEAFAALAAAFVLGGTEGDNLSEKFTNIWNNPRAAWERFKDFVLEVWTVIKTEYQIGVLQIQGVLESIKTYTKDMIDSARTYLVGLKKDVTDFFQAMLDGLELVVPGLQLLVEQWHEMDATKIRKPGQAPGALAGGGMPAMATPQAEADRARARAEADRQKAMADLVEARNAAAGRIAEPLRQTARDLAAAATGLTDQAKKVLADPLKAYQEIHKKFEDIQKGLLEAAAVAKTPEPKVKGRLESQVQGARAQEMAADAYLSHIRAAGASVGAKDHDQVLKDHSKAMKEHAAAMKNLKADLVGVAKIHQKDMMDAMAGIMNMGLL